MGRESKVIAVRHRTPAQAVRPILPLSPRQLSLEYRQPTPRSDWALLAPPKQHVLLQQRTTSHPPPACQPSSSSSASPRSIHVFAFDGLSSNAPRPKSTAVSPLLNRRVRTSGGAAPSLQQQSPAPLEHHAEHREWFIDAQSTAVAAGYVSSSFAGGLCVPGVPAPAPSPTAPLSPGSMPLSPGAATLVPLVPLSPLVPPAPEGFSLASPQKALPPATKNLIRSRAQRSPRWQSASTFHSEAEQTNSIRAVGQALAA